MSTPQNSGDSAFLPLFSGDCCSKDTNTQSPGKGCRHASSAREPIHQVRFVLATDGLAYSAALLFRRPFRTKHVGSWTPIHARWWKASEDCFDQPNSPTRRAPRGNTSRYAPALLNVMPLMRDQSGMFYPAISPPFAGRVVAAHYAHLRANVSRVPPKTCSQCDREK